MAVIFAEFNVRRVFLGILIDPCDHWKPMLQKRNWRFREVL